MAVSKLLNLIISATDRASKTIAGVGESFRDLKTDAAEAQKGSNNLSDSIAWGMVKAQAAIATVQMGVGKLQGMLQQASQIELENLSTATGLEEMLGSFDKAAGFVDSLNSSLARAAAALPGATADYSALARTITDDVAGAFKGADGKIANMEGFTKTLESIATSYGAMAATGTAGIGNMQLFLMKALGGTASQAELMQIESLGGNAQLRTRLEAALKQAGVESLKDLSTEQRIKLIEEVGRKVITPQFLAQSQNTVEGLTQSFISQIFDPMGGIFGVMRDLDTETKGQQTVFEEYKKTLSLLIGPNGLFNQLGKVLEGMGLTGDPMAMLRSGLQTANRFLDRVNIAVARVSAMMRRGENLTNIVQRFLRDFQISLQIPEGSGAKLATWLQENVGKWLDMAGQAAAGVNWGAVMGEIGGFLVGVVREFGGFLANLDSSVYATIAAGLLLQGAVLPMLVRFGAGLAAQFALATAGLPVLLAVGAALAIGALAKAIIDHWEDIKPAILEYMGNIGKSLLGIGKVAIGILTGNFGLVRSGMQDFVNGVLGWFNQLRDAFAIVTGGKTSGQQAADAAADRAEQKFQAARAAQTMNVQPRWMGQIPETVEARWMGQIPNAANGLLPALTAEIRNMPRGASPVVANSSEAILRPEQLRNLVQGSVAVGAGASGGVTLAPTFNISGVSDPEAVAREALRLMEIMFNEYQSGQLA